MRAVLYPADLLLISLAARINRHQQEVLEYLVEENRVLKEQLRGKRLRLNDDQRRRLAAKGKRIGRQALNQVATIVTPDTIMRWHRQLIALKWTFEARRTGRPGILREIKRLIVKMATANSTWGYSRIQGELKGLGHRVARTTIATVLKENGIGPAPERPSSWKSFLKAHWGEVAAIDFFTTEVWTRSGLRTYYVLFVIDLKSRRAHLAGLTRHPKEGFMAQVARNLTDCEDGFLRLHKALICDRDAKFTAQFRQILGEAGVKVVRTPPRAPNCNAFAERFVLSIKSECLDRMIFFGESSLRHALREYLAHYHRERAHQGIGNEVIDARPPGRGDVRCSERLGGLLKHYQRAA